MAQLTKKAILMAFINLLEQRPFEKITVRDIVVECGITRNTFYYHFEDVYGVLKELLASETARKSAQIGESDKLEDCFVEALGFAVEHKKAAYHICCSSRKDELLRCLNAEADGTLRRYIARKAQGTGASQQDIERIAAFYRRALLSFLSEWADNGMRTDLAEDVRTLGRIMEGTVNVALQNGVASGKNA